MTRSFPPAERTLLTGGMVAAALVPLNSTMIAVGLPDVARDLDVSRSMVSWLITAYLVMMALCQPLAGRAGDRFGSRRVALVALAGFALMSAAAAAAPGFAALLVARVVQAVFGAALIPNVQALVRSGIAADHRGRAFGVLGLGIGAGAAVGPVLGGVLVDIAGWRSIFFLNAPVALAAIAVMARVAVEAHPDAVDLHGGGRLLHGAFLAACVAHATGNLTQYTILLVVPLLLDDRGWTGSQVGLVLLTLTVGMLLLNPLGGSLGDRRGRAHPVIVGMAVLFAGAALLAVVADDVPVLLVVAMILVGIGVGLSNASLQAAALEVVPASTAASAAGLFSTSRYVGSITGSLLLSALGPRPVLAVTAVAALLAVGAAVRLRQASPSVAVASPHR